MVGTIKRIGPLALTTTLTTNIYNNPSALIYDVIRAVHVVNKTATAATVTLYVGATGANAAGTEIWAAKSVPANDFIDWYMPFKMTSADFLVGGAGAATAITIMITTEQFAVAS